MEMKPIPSPAKAPDREGAGGSAPPKTPEQKESSPREEMAHAIVGFIAALRDYEPEDERARISLRIAVEQMPDRFNGNMDRVAEHYSLVPDLENARTKLSTATEDADKSRLGRELAAAESMQGVYTFITGRHPSLIKQNGRKEIAPLITAVNPETTRRKTSPMVAGGLELNTKTLEQHLDEFLKWLDALHDHSGSRVAPDRDGRNLFLDIIGGQTHFNAPVASIKTTVEDLRAQERGMKRDIARRDLRASIRRELERVGVKASNISIEISGNPLSNPDGTIDIVLDRIEIKDAELLERRSSALPKGAVGDPELDTLTQERLCRFIAGSLDLLFIRSPRHTRWISFAHDFSISFTKGADNTPVRSIPRQELGLELPVSYEEALIEIGNEIKKVATNRSRTLAPYLQRGRWRIVMTDIENYGAPMEERFAPPRVEQLAFQLMRHNPDFRRNFIDGKLRIIQLFGDDMLPTKDIPKTLLDLRAKKNIDPLIEELGPIGAYTFPEDPSEERREHGIVIIGPTGVVRRRKITPKVDPKTGKMTFELMRSLGFADWERWEESRRKENIVPPGHSAKFKRLISFYDALAQFAYPADPRVASLVRSFGIVVSQEGMLSDVSKIAQMLHELSNEDKNAWTEANKYFNHYYSLFDYMQLATAEGDTITLNAAEVARHAEEYLMWRESGYDKLKAPKGGTNIFRLAQTHFGVKDKGLEQRAHALLEDLEDRSEKRGALSPEEKKELEELSDLQKQLEDFAFATNRPEPDTLEREDILGELRFYEHYLGQLKTLAAMIEEQKAGARERAELLKSLLEKFSVRQ